MTFLGQKSYLGDYKHFSWCFQVPESLTVLQLLSYVKKKKKKSEGEDDE